MTLGIGIIGCGLIGQKRAAALGVGGKLIACADKDAARAERLATTYGAQHFEHYQAVLALPEVHMVIVATLHDSLAEIVLAAVTAGKHVLVEKPAARNARELLVVIEAAQKYQRKVRVGFNHRYHRSLRKAKALIDADEIGELMFVRARYGHGGRVGYDKEWRANPALSGGGELIDQGPHLIDLSRWLLGEFTEINGHAQTCFWDMEVDDNAFMILRTASKKTAFLHASCTEWKNLFSMEIYGRNGKLDLNGLGGSYGVEKLTWYRMLPQMGPPETTAWEYPMADDSWAVEITEFYDDIRLNREPSASLNDAYQSLLVVDYIYKESGYDYCT